MHVPTTLAQGTAGAEGNAAALGWPGCPPCFVLSGRVGRKAGKEHGKRKACAAACCHKWQQGKEPSGPWGRTRTSAPGCGEEQGTLAAHCSPCPSSLPERVPTCCSAQQNSSMHPAPRVIAPDSLIVTKKAQDGPGAHGHSLGQSHKCPQAGEPLFPCTSSHCCQDSAPAPGSSSNSPRQHLQ